MHDGFLQKGSRISEENRFILAPMMILCVLSTPGHSQHVIIFFLVYEGGVDLALILKEIGGKQLGEPTLSGRKVIFSIPVMIQGALSTRW